MRQLAVVGAGSWGTALSIALAPRFERVKLWARSAAHVESMIHSRENSRYLPGYRLPDAIEPVADLAGALRGSAIVLIAVPSRYLRQVCELLVPHLEAGSCAVSATKGIENETLLRMSELISQIAGSKLKSNIAVLSGPTFAKEVAAGEPAAVVIASSNERLAGELQAAFSGPSLRFYTSADVIGVEIGAATKNVIAIGAGICCGLGLGGNSVAALVTRGLAELTRLAVALGGESRTLAGLAGLGDLVLTTTGDLSRNRYVGLQLGVGRSLSDTLSSMTQVAEGVDTCRAVNALAAKHGVAMPISESMYEILYEGKSPAQAIRELMERPLTRE